MFEYSEELKDLVEALGEYKEEKDVVRAPTQEEIGEYIGYSDTKVSQMCNGDYTGAVRLAGLIPRSSHVPGDFMEAFQHLDEEKRETARAFEDNGSTGKFYSGESSLTFNQAREKTGQDRNTDCTGGL